METCDPFLLRLAHGAMRRAFGNCVEKAHLGAKKLREMGVSEAAIDHVNCRTEVGEYHRVLVVTTNGGYQVVLCGRQLSPIRLDDCVYTDWYGGLGLNQGHDP